MTLRIDDATDTTELVAGTLPGALPRQTDIGGLFCARPLESMALIPESQWLDRIRAMIADKAFIGDKITFDPKLHFQNGIKFCWSYSLCQAVEAERQVAGLPFVLLAPESLAESVGYRNKGNHLDTALAYAAKNGIASRKYVPQYKITPSQWSPEWKIDRANYVPLEWWDLDGDDVWAATVTTLLSGKGCFVGLDWWGHAVFYDRLVLDGAKIGVHTPNSHGPGKDVNLFGRMAVPSLGSFALRSVTFTG